MALNRRGYQILGYIALALAVAWAMHHHSPGNAVKRFQQSPPDYLSTAGSVSIHQEENDGELDNGGLDYVTTTGNGSHNHLAARKLPVPEVGQGPYGNDYGVPWWVEQYRVRGEQVHLWMVSENLRPGDRVWTHKDASNIGWRTVATATNDAAIKQEFNHYGPKSNDQPNGFAGLPSTKQHELFGNALKHLQTTGLAPAAPGQRILTYRTKQTGQIPPPGDMTCDNNYLDGLIWVYKTWGYGRHPEEWSQNVYLQWEQPLRDKAVAGIDLKEAQKRLNSVILVRVSDEGTLAVVYWLLANWGAKQGKTYTLDGVKDWNLPRTWTAQDTGRKQVLFAESQPPRKAAAALLGTLSGLKAARLMGLRRSELGSKKLHSVTIFKDDNCPDVYHPRQRKECLPTLVFKFEAAVAKDKPQGGAGSAEFPSPVTVALGNNNIYAIMARGKHATAKQADNYHNHAIKGKLDELGNPTAHRWGFGPGVPHNYYDTPGAANPKTGYLRDAPYALQEPGQGLPGPGAGVTCKNTGPQPANPGNQGAGVGSSNQGGGAGSSSQGGSQSQAGTGDNMDLDEFVASWHDSHGSRNHGQGGTGSDNQGGDQSHDNEEGDRMDVDDWINYPPDNNDDLYEPGPS